MIDVKTVGIVEENDEIKYQFSPLKYSAGISIKCPTNESIVSDWDLLEKLWSHSLHGYLKTDLTGLPVLIAEKPYTPQDIRHK